MPRGATEEDNEEVIPQDTLTRKVHDRMIKADESVKVDNNNHNDVISLNLFSEKMEEISILEFKNLPGPEQEDKKIRGISILSTIF